MSDRPTPQEDSAPAASESLVLVSLPGEPAAPSVDTSAPSPVTAPVAALSASAVPPILADATAVHSQAPTAAPAAPAAHPVIFHGRADEFFRIWIVNTLLTIVTLGVFFAWAKVRKRRYLRGSTELMGHRFDYRADPVRLLLGHGVVLLLFLGYGLFGVVYPAIRFGVMVLGVVLLPWIVVRSLNFNAHNTVYRGIHFRFNASLSAAFKVYLLEPILIVLSLGFYYPAWERSKRSYVVSNHRLGDAYFHFDAPTGRFYSTYFFAGLVMFAALGAGGYFVTWLTRTQGAQPGLVQLIPFFVIYAFGFFLSRQLVFARLFNHVWNHTRVDEHRFRGHLQTDRWVGLQLTNLAAIVASAGLLYPWAVIRAHRAVAASLEFIPAGPIESIQRVGGAAGSATGDMAAEFIGLDFGL